jgi:hypothetical protein
MICKICRKEIILVPSAIERAEKYGGTAKQYTALFQTHPDCFLKKRSAETQDLLKRSR